MTQDLFRREAVEFSTQRLYGHVVVRPRLSHAALLGFIVACVGLLALTLTRGVHVETRRVSGALIRAASEDRIHALLYVPKDVAKAVAIGQRIELTVTGFSPGAVGRVAASIAEVSSQLRIAPPRTAMPGMVYAPVTLAVAESSLRDAGLPADGHYELSVETDLVVSRKSWLQWLVASVSGPTARA